jgi:hypothetical protein
MSPCRTLCETSNTWRGREEGHGWSGFRPISISVSHVNGAPNFSGGGRDVRAPRKTRTRCAEIGKTTRPWGAREKSLTPGGPLYY